MSHVVNSMIGTGFSPVSVGNCVLWLPAESLSLNDSDAIATWADLSGSGNTASQSTAGYRPTFKTNIVNGRAVARFDGTNDKLNFTGLLTGSASHTLFLVIKYTDFINSRPLFGTATFGSAMGYFETSDDTLQYGGTTANTMSAATWTVLEIYRSGTSVEFYKSGTLIGSFTRANNNTYTYTEIGWSYDDDGTSVFAGDIAEMLMYTSALSTVDRARVRRYLGAKYGITIA